MATSMPHMEQKANEKSVPKPAAPTVIVSEDYGAVFSFIARNRLAVMISPFCLAAIMVILNIFAGQRVHAVIDFVTGVSQK